MPGVITERLAVIIDAKAGGAIKEFDKLSGQAERAGATTGGLSSAFQSMGLSAGAAGTAATAGIAAVVVGVGLLAKGAQAAVTSTLDLAGQIRGLQRVTGASAEEASRLAAELSRFGIETETAQKGLFKFSRTLAETPEKLTALGVAIARNADGTVNVTGTLRNLGQAYQRTTDSTQRAELAQTAFGRAGLQLLPILGATADQLAAIDRTAEARGLIFKPEDLENARVAQASLQQIKQEVKGIGVVFGKEVMPVLADELKRFAIGLDAIIRYAKDPSKGLGAARKAAAKDVDAAIGFQKTKDAVDEETESLQSLNREQKEATDAVLGLAAAQVGLQQAVLSRSNAERALTAARRERDGFDKAEKARMDDLRQTLASASAGVVDAYQREEAAGRSLDDLRRQLAEGLIGEAAAHRALTISALDAEAAQQRLIDAQKTLDELLNPSQRTKDTAADDRRAAELDVADAQARVIEATKRLNQARTAADRIAAQRDLERAQLDVRTAQRRLEDAKKAEDRVNGVGEEAARDLVAAENDLARARVDAEASAAQLAEAKHAADVAARDDTIAVRDAVQEVARAHDSVRNALNAESTARDAILEAEKTRTDRRVELEAKVATAALAVQTAENGVVSAIIKAKEEQDKMAEQTTTNVNKMIKDLDRLAKAYGIVLPDRFKTEDVPDVHIGPVRHGGVFPNAGAASSAPQVIQLQVDGRQMAEVVTGHQERSARNGGQRYAR